MSLVTNPWALKHYYEYEYEYDSGDHKRIYTYWSGTSTANTTVVATKVVSTAATSFFTNPIAGTKTERFIGWIGRENVTYPELELKVKQVEPYHCQKKDNRLDGGLDWRTNGTWWRRVVGDVGLWGYKGNETGNKKSAEIEPNYQKE